MDVILEARFKKFKTVKFPSPPESDDLANWIFDYILELDGYFAGIFSNIEKQKNIQSSVLKKLREDILLAIQKAPKSSIIEGNDKEVYHHFLEYLNLMLEITNNALEAR